MFDNHIKNTNLTPAIPLENYFQPQSNKVDIAIFSAMPEELEFIHNTLSTCKSELLKAAGFEFKVYNYNNHRILVTHTGLGTTFAATVLTLVHQHFRPNYVFLTGTAGGIKPELQLCDVVIVEKAFEAEIQGAFTALKGTPFESCLTHPLKNLPFPPLYAANEELVALSNTISSSEEKIHKGTVVSSNSFPAPQELFDRIKSQSPYSIDMETSAFYQVAWLLKIPVLAIRGISNVLNHDGTDDKVHTSDVKGSAKAAAKVLLKIIDKLLLKLLDKKIDVHESKELEKLIHDLELQPHPEGGMYARIFESAIEVKSLDTKRYDSESRHAGSSIYYLLKGNDFSAWHSLKSDEIWHYYKGSPVKIHVINKLGNYETFLLGDPTIHSGALFQIVIAADNWFAAELLEKDSYCLVGCTVTPAFEFKDFHLADRKYLTSLFPQHGELIKQFTRIINDPISDRTKEMSCSHI